MNYLDESVVLSPEQVTSVMLTYLKGVAQNALEKPVSDCVISVRFIFLVTLFHSLTSSAHRSPLIILMLKEELFSMLARFPASTALDY